MQDENLINLIEYLNDIKQILSINSYDSVLEEVQNKYIYIELHYGLSMQEFKSIQEEIIELDKINNSNFSSFNSFNLIKKILKRDDLLLQPSKSEVNKVISFLNEHSVNFSKYSQEFDGSKNRMYDTMIEKVPNMLSRIRKDPTYLYDLGFLFGMMYMSVHPDLEERQKIIEKRGYDVFKMTDEEYKNMKKKIKDEETEKLNQIKIKNKEYEKLYKLELKNKQLKEKKLIDELLKRKPSIKIGVR